MRRVKFDPDGMRDVFRDDDEYQDRQEAAHCEHKLEWNVRGWLNIREEAIQES